MASILLFAVIGVERSNGCGPEFPNWLLNQGDQAVLAAPEGNFAAELARLDLGQVRIRALPPQNENGYSAQSAEAELGDLREALKQAKTPDDQAIQICRNHSRQRRQLQEFIEARPASSSIASANVDREAQFNETSETAASTRFEVQVVKGLPPEFADYFEGFIAWHNPVLSDKEPARVAWERLLGRPEDERRFKSTWAAFMLGKSWQTSDPEKAAGYFKKVRELARRGYHDSLGLAAASLGLEAKGYLMQSNYQGAIEVYLDQLASGDPTATNSLLVAATRALAAGPDVLRALAKNPRTQKVITAYVISRTRLSYVYSPRPTDQEDEAADLRSPASTWLEAAESAEIGDLDSAEALALAAYRAGDMKTATRWIRRAPASLLAQWLQAKLFLRAGQLEAAATLLARISLKFPIAHEGTNAHASTGRKDTLTMGGDSYAYYHTSAERQVHGELGVLRLARGDYVQALDSLLNAGFWMDAAYVAERVLTLDELITYVDRFWPAVSAQQVAEERERFAGSEVYPAVLRDQIRYLLARRLTRESRYGEARQYYPAEWENSFDQLMAGLKAARDESRAPDERAAAFFQTAMLMRTNGMELIGTEVGPDWHYHDGQFNWGVEGASRGSNELAVVLHATDDELRRNAAHHPDPDLRFHYRYQAASLAWEAAKLLPNNNDTTAYILWQGGRFIKDRDPRLADRFYKALVRRNRKTVLGAEADRQRWFPAIDENGNIKPRKRTTVSPADLEQAQLREPIGGPNSHEQLDPRSEHAPTKSASQSEQVRIYMYTVHAGDTLASIEEGFTEAGVLVDRHQILTANPGLDPARLVVGQVIRVESASPALAHEKSADHQP